MPIEDIVNVQITRQTTAVSRAGFGTVLIVGPNPTFAERIRFYGSDLSALATDLTGGTAAAEYRAAATLMSQSPKPTRFAVGREDVGDANIGATLNAIKNASNDWYGLIITARTSAKNEGAADYTPYPLHPQHKQDNDVSSHSPYNL